MSREWGWNNVSIQSSHTLLIRTMSPEAEGGPEPQGRRRPFCSCTPREAPVRTGMFAVRFNLLSLPKADPS